MVPMFTSDIKSSFPGLKFYRFWKEEHDLQLLQAIIKHGYGRWLAILEDLEYGLQQVIRKELQLPITITNKGLPTKNVGAFTAMDAKDPCLEVDGYNPVVDGQVKPAVVGHYCNLTCEEREEAAYGLEEKMQLSRDGINSSEKEPGKLKDAQFQKKMTAFLKRRVTVLEEALNAEYHKVSSMSSEEQKRCKDINVDPMPSDSPILCRQSSLLLPIAPEEILTFAADNKLNHLEIARLYNEMCKLVNENEHDLLQSWSGNKSAGFRLGKKLCLLHSLCQDVCRILAMQ